MDYGIYTAPERVERDGMLVCFEGERMTRDEARRRGLIGQKAAAKPAKEPAKAAAAPSAQAAAEKAPPEERAKKLVNSKTVKELEAMAQALGVAFPKGATKAVIADAIVKAEE